MLIEKNKIHFTKIEIESLKLGIALTQIREIDNQQILDSLKQELIYLLIKDISKQARQAQSNHLQQELDINPNNDVFTCNIPEVYQNSLIIALEKRKKFLSEINITEIGSLQVGAFSGYKGMDGKLIYGIYFDMETLQEMPSLQSALIKQVLVKLNPTDGWDDSLITTLKQPLSVQVTEQDHTEICIGSNGELVNQLTKEDIEAAFGTGQCRISKNKLLQLAESVQISLDSSGFTKTLFLKLQELIEYFMVDSKTAKNLTLGQVIEAAGEELSDYLDDWESLEYTSLEDLKKVLDTPLKILASTVCHSQTMHLFTEAYYNPETGEAYDKLKNSHLDEEKVPITKISIAALNVQVSTGLCITTKHIDDDVELYINDISAKERAITMWRCALETTIRLGSRIFIAPAIGLGAFCTDEQRPIMAKAYFSALFELLQSEKYKNQFDAIIVNPMTKATCSEHIFNDLLETHQEKLILNLIKVYATGCNVKFIAEELRKRNINATLIVPGDPDNVLGIRDIGQGFKKGNYAGDEDIAATSTTVLGSRFLSDGYSNPNKIYVYHDPDNTTKSALLFSDFSNNQQLGANKNSISTDIEHSDISAIVVNTLLLKPNT